jgi:hypothetical protein
MPSLRLIGAVAVLFACALVVITAHASKDADSILSAKFEHHILHDFSSLFPVNEAHDASKTHTLTLPVLSALHENDAEQLGGDETVTLTFRVDTSMFHKGYSEVVVDSAGNVLETLSNTPPQCYYRGHVIGAEAGSSFVHLSACHADKLVHGWVTLDKTQYNIEPLRAHGIAAATEAAGPSHVIFRTQHVIAEEGEQDSHAKCGVVHTAEEQLKQASMQEEEEEEGSKTFRTLMSTGECASAASKIKYSEIVIANDESLFEVMGETMETHSADVFAAAEAIYTSTGFECDVNLRLKGQVSFRAGAPSDIVARSCGDQVPWLSDLYNNNNAACCSTGVCGCAQTGTTYCLGTNDFGNLDLPGCYSITRGTSTCGPNKKMVVINVLAEVDSTDPSEIGHAELLETFGQWGMDTVRDELEDIFGDIDNMHLFTSHDFAGATVGYAGVSGMCGGPASSGVEELTGTIAYDAAVFAHELGHNFGMLHDAACNGEDCFIMNSVINSPAPEAFSATSEGYTDTYFDDRYIVTGAYTKCLDNNEADKYSTEKAYCGNGIVEAGESCDEGVWTADNSDACCDQSTCTLNAGCECANNQPCCEDGSFLGSSTTCRDKRGDCDIVETCTGSSGDCPVNFFLRAGTACTVSSSATGDTDGVCYAGRCMSNAGVCEAASAAYPFGSPDCGIHDCATQYFCKDEVGAQSCVTEGKKPPDGFPCAAAGQCYDSFCEASSNLRIYYWVLGAWSTDCVDDENFRSVECMSEEETLASDTKCTGDRPSSRRNCDGTLIDPTSGEFNSGSSSSGFDPDAPLRSLCLPDIPCACPTLQARHSQVLSPSSGAGQPNGTLNVACEDGFAFPDYRDQTTVSMSCFYDRINYSSWDIALPRCENKTLIGDGPGSSFDAMIIVYAVLSVVALALVILIFKHRDCLSKPTQKQPLRRKSKYSNNPQHNIQMSMVSGAARNGAGKSPSRPSVRPGMKTRPSMIPGKPQRGGTVPPRPTPITPGPKPPARRPMLAPLGSSSKGALPSGWKEVVSSAGKIYFYHKATKTTQWKRPHA